MKYFIALMAFVALANAEPTCDQCKQGVMKLGEYLNTDAELAAVEEALSDLVCTTLPEDQIEGCIEFVYGNWPGMAKALFAWPNTVPEICGQLGYCKKFTPRVRIQLYCILRKIEFKLLVSKMLWRGSFFC